MNSLHIKNRSFITLQSLFFVANLCAASFALAAEQPATISENNWNLKTLSNKNWLHTKIDTFAKTMINKHSYTHKSFEHVRDLGILYLLPAHVSQSVLFKQRENMKNFLVKNEEQAFDNLCETLNVGKEERSTIKQQIKEAQDFNLGKIQKGSNFNTHRDENLPNEWNDALNHAATYYDINEKSFNRKATERNVHAYTRFQYSSNNYYIPRTIALNVNRYQAHQTSTNFDEQAFLNDMANHEMTHLAKNDGITSAYVSEMISKKTNIKPQNIPECNNLDAAQEKTADTLLACSYPEAAKSAAICAEYLLHQRKIQPAGYPDNANDLYVINTNWETSQRIQHSQNTLQSCKKKIRQAMAINLF